MRCTQSICPVPLWASPSLPSVSKYHPVPCRQVRCPLVGGWDFTCGNPKTKSKTCCSCRDFNCKCDSAAVLMAVHIFQAVLCEAEAVAHCHRVQVGAKREQVCMSGLQPTVAFNVGNIISNNKQTENAMVLLYFLFLFAALSTTRVYFL